jgi:hypothetical protein
MDAFILPIGIRGGHRHIHIMDTIHTILIGIHTLVMVITLDHMDMIVILISMGRAILVTRGVEMSGGIMV